MNDDTFENLEVWKDGIELAVRVYELFRNCRDFEFRNQVQRAAVSVSNNIAEGAKGSCGEVRSAYLARRVGLLAELDADRGYCRREAALEAVAAPDCCAS
jgi:hypothetical protein